MTDLRDYTGTFCFMCGCPIAKHRFCSGDCKDDGSGTIDSGPPAMSRPPTPHLHRTCDRCGYEWLEKTLSRTIGERRL